MFFDTVESYGITLFEQTTITAPTKNKQLFPVLCSAALPPLPSPLRSIDSISNFFLLILGMAIVAKGGYLPLPFVSL